jgi:macrolide transport system ATP-binding/permease protein
LKLISGMLQPDSGTLQLPGPGYYAEQRTDLMPRGFPDLFESPRKSVFRLRASLGIEDDWQEKWDKLSHGERKRAQIAAALFAEPLILAIDEPSNHLDTRGRTVLLDALKLYKGIGILVSHDRELMDILCQDTIFLDPPEIDVRRCAYSVAVRERERDNKSRETEHELARKEVKKLKDKVIRQREKTSRTSKLRSKRHIRTKDHDAKAKKDLGRLTGKDAIEGRIYKRFETKLERAKGYQDSIEFRKSFPLGIKFQEEEAGRFFPLIIPSGSLKLGKEKTLRMPELTIQYGDKVGLLGNNGSGKSTFLNYLIGSTHLPENKLIYIPQEIPATQSRSILERVHQYDREIKGQMMILISRLGSDPRRVLETDIPTPGEVRKLLLAEGILKNPGMIILDEPTNHMDLPSIECVERALKECTCTQLLVSHDRFFLRNTADTFWFFSEITENEFSMDDKFTMDW